MKKKKIDLRDELVNGNDDFVIECIENGYDIQKDSAGVFSHAVLNKKEKVILACLAKVDAKKISDELRFAPSANLKIVKLLVEAGADVNHRFRYKGMVYLPAIYMAVVKNKITIVKYLLKQGAKYESDILFRVRPGNIKMLDLLLSHQPLDIEVTDSNSHTPLTVMSGKRGEKARQSVRALIAYGANINPTQGDAPIEFAARSSDGEMIELLLDSGAYVDGNDETLSPLIDAARAPNLDTLKVLLKRGADINFKFKLNWAKDKTALWFAENNTSARGKTKKEIIQLLKMYSTGNYVEPVKKEINFPETLHAFSSVLASKNPKAFEALPEGVSPSTLSAVEKQLKVTLPEDFKSFYLWRNGQGAATLTTVGDEIEEDIMSIESIQSETQEMRVDAKDNGLIWSKNWVPFASSIFGDYLCLDLSKANYGKVIAWSHEDDDEPSVINDSFAEWLDDLVTLIKDT